MSHDKVWPEYPIEREFAQLSLEDLNDPEFAIFEKELKSLDLDDVALPESGLYFDALEARIMGALDAAIESGEVANRDKSKAGVTSISAAAEVAANAMAATMKRRRSVSARAGQFALVASVALVTTGQVRESIGHVFSSSKIASEGLNTASLTPPSSSAGQQLSATHQAAPMVLTETVVGFQSDADLALEIAARRMVAFHKANK